MTPIVLRRRVTPRSRWLYGLAAFVFALLFVFVFFYDDIGSPLLKSLVKTLGPCSALALVCLWQSLVRPDLLWTIEEHEITVRRGTAFGRRTRSWPMRDVARIRVRRIDGDNWPDTYYVELKLASGKRLKLPPYKRQGRSDEIAEQIEAWSKA